MLEEIFISDAKNYHAWSYRIWFIERFSLWDGEMESAEQLIDDDVCNNSAWSYRCFLRMKSGEEFGVDFVSKEIDYVLNKRLPTDYNNESAWAYMRGLLATSEEEEKSSANSNAKRCLITKFP